MIQDVGGMTCLHRAARMAEDGVVRMLMSKKADPNLPTFPGRSPGLQTPLALLGEADMSGMDTDRIDRMVTTTRLLVEAMTEEGLRQQTTKGMTAFHSAAYKGNFEFLRAALPFSAKTIGEKALAREEDRHAIVESKGFWPGMSIQITARR